MIGTKISADGWPKVGIKPCGHCGKRAMRQPDGRLYDPVRRADGADSYERHLCVRVKP